METTELNDRGNRFAMSTEGAFIRRAGCNCLYVLLWSKVHHKKSKKV